MSDPEIEAISAVATALADLEDEAPARVLRWAAERFGVTLSGRPNAGSTASTNGGASVEKVTEDEIKAEAPDVRALC